MRRARTDAGAVERVYASHYPAFCRMAATVTGDPDSGRDAVQEGFAKGLASLDSYRGDWPLPAWLWRIVLRAALDARRRRGPVPVADAGEWEPALPHPETSYTVIPVTPGSTVPGLPGLAPLLVPAVSAPPPTVAQCAEAWNAQAPGETRRWLAEREPLGVRIGIAITRADDSRPAAICQLRFFLDAGGETVAAQGPWERGGVLRWQGAIQALPGPMAGAFLRSANGLAHGDGTVSCTDRCDEPPRLPSPTPSPASGPSAMPDACALLTPAEVVDVVGSRPRQRTPGHGSDIDSCIWHDGPVTTPANEKLVVQVARMPRAVFEDLMSRQRGAQPLEGVGEVAYALREGRGVIVWHAGYSLAIDNRGAMPLETLERVAAAAIARM